MKKYLLQLRRGVRYVDETGATLLENNIPVRDDWASYTNKTQDKYRYPQDGELVAEFEVMFKNGRQIKTTPRLKIGDGVSAFADLEYISVDSFILPTKASVTIYPDKWEQMTDENGEAIVNRYFQYVTVDNAIVTPNSQIDLQPTPQDLAVFHEKDLTFVAINNQCTVRVCLIGQVPPTAEYTFMATVTELTDVTTDEIVGNTTATPNPKPDWEQIDTTKADYIKNKPTLGELASKSIIEWTDLSVEVQNAISSGGGGDVTELKEYIDDEIAEAKSSIKSAYQYAQDGGYTGDEEDFARDINPDNILSLAIPVKGIDYFDGKDGKDGVNGKDYVLNEADKAEIADMVDGATVVQSPKYVNSVSEMTDTNRVYVLASTGRIWAYMDSMVEQEVTIRDDIKGTSDNPYQTGRLSSSGTLSTDIQTHTVTPYIDLTKAEYQGKTIQLHLDGNRYFSEISETYIMSAVFDLQKGVILGRGYSTLESGGTLGELPTISAQINGETSATLTIPIPLDHKGGTRVGYLRFCGHGNVTDSVYITYQVTQTVEGGAWADTGTSYSPLINNDILTAIAERAASIVDNNLLSIIGSGEVSV